MLISFFVSKRRVIDKVFFSITVALLLMSLQKPYKAYEVMDIKESNTIIYEEPVLSSPTKTEEPTGVVGVIATVANTPSPTPIPIVKLEEGIYNTIFRGAQTAKNVQIENCTLPCSGEQIEKKLQFNPDIWRAVIDQSVMYVHSGRFTYSQDDYEFGEIFRENYNAGTLIGTELCFEESLCYSIIDYKVPNTQEIRVSSSEIFPQQEINDYIIVTCENPFDGNSLKLIMLIRLIN